MFNSLRLSFTSRPSGFAEFLSSVLPTAFLCLVSLSSAFAQTDSSLIGTVTTKDGQPGAAVVVVGSVSKECCPVKRESATTDPEGHFRLDHPGAVVHFLKEGLQPQTIVLQPGETSIQITMEPSTDNFVVPICGKHKPGLKRLGWGVQFDVPKSRVNVSGGKWDVDYVRYLIKPRSGQGYLELWFGPYAISSDPDDDQFINSARFTERNVVPSEGLGAGIDTRGVLHSGPFWRQTAFVGLGGSRYQAPTSNVAALFDEIVDSMCKVPQPAR